jgi:hypothetical protein
MRCCLPSLRPAAFPPPSPPRISAGFVRCFNSTTQPSDSSSVPRQLRLLDFLSRPGIAQATAGQTRSPRFRRDPFVRDVASDPGRATVPRVTAPHMLPSAVATASAPATSRISWLNPTPQTITVYASPWSSPSTTQHSLPGGRYPFPGPDFHRLDRASFAWRTAPPSSSTLSRTPIPARAVKSCSNITERSHDPGSMSRRTTQGSTEPDNPTVRHAPSKPDAAPDSRTARCPEAYMRLRATQPEPSPARPNISSRAASGRRSRCGSPISSVSCGSIAFDCAAHLGRRTSSCSPQSRRTCASWPKLLNRGRRPLLPDKGGENQTTDQPRRSEISPLRPNKRLPDAS